MLSIKSILNILALGSVMVDKQKPRHLMEKAICVVVAAVVSALLLGASLFALIIYAYQVIIAYGVPRIEAGLCVMGFMILLTGIAVYCVSRFAKNFIDTLTGKTDKKVIDINTVEHVNVRSGGVFEAFIDGFNRGRLS